IFPRARQWLRRPAAQSRGSRFTDPRRPTGWRSTERGLGGYKKRYPPYKAKSVVSSADQPHHQMHQTTGSEAGKDIVEHDAEAASDIAVYPAQWPGLDDIQHAEHQEAQQQPRPAGRHQPEGDPDTCKLVPDDAFVVVHSQILRNLAAQPDTKQHAD